MKHILILFFACTLTLTISAQDIDKERMHRDLEVAENALSTVIVDKQSKFPGVIKMQNSLVEAGYVKNYGVVFNVSINDDHGWLVRRIKGTQSAEVELDEKLDDHIKDEKSRFIENSKIFLADYASIIGQLNDDERISIRRGGHDGNHNQMREVYVTALSDESEARGIGNAFVESINPMTNSELIVEVSVDKIKALQKGTINRKDFLNAVEVIENEMDYTKDVDLETLSAMFHRLYEQDLSNTYYVTHQPKYSKLSNFGVIVKMRVYSSFQNDDLYFMPTIDKDKLTLKERNKYVMELLPQFESDFKDNLVNYARTLKKLDSDDILMFEVKMTACKECEDFPRVMKFSVKKSVLHDYNRGQISLKRAIESVSVDRIP